VADDLTWRNLLSVLALSGMVAVVVPVAFARHYGISLAEAWDAAGWASVAIGAPLLAVGLALFVAWLWGFVRRGRGTLAPWDRPWHLVIEGPYRRVRNPMISGVLLVLLGEATTLRSLPHLVWAGLFAVANALYLPLLEEPVLERRFGDAYRTYRAHVPRVVPCLRPWRGPDAPSSSARDRGRQRP